MTIENSELNKSGALPDRTRASQAGGTGDGNAPGTEALSAGFSRVDDPDRMPRWLTSLGEREDPVIDLAGGSGDADAEGFLGRPHGWER